MLAPMLVVSEENGSPGGRSSGCHRKRDEIPDRLQSREDEASSVGREGEVARDARSLDEEERRRA